MAVAADVKALLIKSVEFSKTIFQLILAKAGKLVHQETLGKPSSADISLLLGLVSTMKSLAQSIGPSPRKQFQTVTTGEYKMHYLETPSQYQFILFTSPETKDLIEELRQIYFQLFIPLVLRNPMFDFEHPNCAETCTVFVNKLRAQLIAIPS